MIFQKQKPKAGTGGPWFALWPVKLESGGVALWQTVQRTSRGYSDYSDYGRFRGWAYERVEGDETVPYSPLRLLALPLAAALFMVAILGWAFVCFTLILLGFATLIAAVAFTVVIAGES